MVPRKGLVPRHIARAALCGSLILVSSAAPVKAQGFFDFLFGSSGPKPGANAPVAATAKPPSVVPAATEYRPAPRGPATGQSTPRPSGGARYRTVCVRLCDGYYWPISHDATRSQFYRDAETCRSQCDNDARLFFAPSPGADINAAVDQRGLAYASLDTAFLYRKQRVAGCVCKPVPWSAREMNRHRTYALEAVAERNAAEADREALAKLAEASPAGAGAPDAEPSHKAVAADRTPGESNPGTSPIGAVRPPVTVTAGLAAETATRLEAVAMPSLANDVPPLVAAAVREPRLALLSSITPPAVTPPRKGQVAEIIGRHHIEPVSTARFGTAGERR